MASCVLATTTLMSKRRRESSSVDSSEWRSDFEDCPSSFQSREELFGHLGECHGDRVGASERNREACQAGDDVSPTKRQRSGPQREPSAIVIALGLFDAETFGEQGSALPSEDSSDANEEEEEDGASCSDDSCSDDGGSDGQPGESPRPAISICDL